MKPAAGYITGLALALAAGWALTEFNLWVWVVRVIGCAFVLGIFIQAVRLIVRDE